MIGTAVNPCNVNLKACAGFLQSSKEGLGIGSEGFGWNKVSGSCKTSLWGTKLGRGAGLQSSNAVTKKNGCISSVQNRMQKELAVSNFLNH